MSRQALEAQKCKAIAFSCVGGSDDQNKLFRTPKKWKSEIWLNAWEQKAENRKQKAENRKQKAENRKQNSRHVAASFQGRSRGGSLNRPAVIHPDS
jgi:hypothetical protein